MTQERADEIVRKVIYERLNILPEMEESIEAFHVGRMFGKMERQLEIELALEVDPKESEKTGAFDGKAIDFEKLEEECEA